MDASKGKDKLTATISAGLKDLLGMKLMPSSEKLSRFADISLLEQSLKSTGSAFENFHLCEYTTLAPVNDRIFSTSVESKYTLTAPASEEISIGGLGKLGEKYGYATIAKNVKAATLETFAVDESASVQVSSYPLRPV